MRSSEGNGSIGLEGGSESLLARSLDGLEHGESNFAVLR